MKGYFCVDSCGACSGNRTVEDASLGRRLDILEPGHGCPRPLSKWRPRMSQGVSRLNSRPVNTGRLLLIIYYVTVECCVFAVRNLETQVFTVCLWLGCVTCWSQAFCTRVVSYVLNIPAAFELTLTGPTRPSGAVKRWTAECRKSFHCVLGPGVSL